ncbi:MAG: glycine C-acetyltransferase, partial [Ornithinimicrobium sp.]
MYAFKDDLTTELAGIREAGLYKSERQLTTSQSAHVATTAGAALNFCANNYLGLANHPDVVEAARDALDRWGFGMASVRFICGTQ